MRRKIINIVIIMISLFLFNTSIVNAGSIEEMNIEVTLDKEGNAYFTETWKMNVTSGTEVYKPIYNLKNETVSNFSASRDGENLYVCAEDKVPLLDSPYGNQISTIDRFTIVNVDSNYGDYTRVTVNFRDYNSAYSGWVKTQYIQKIAN